MGSIDHEALVRLTMDYPHGCDEQKIKYLKSVTGLSDPLALIKPEGPTITAHFQWRCAGTPTESRTANGIRQAAKELRLHGAELIGEGAWGRSVLGSRWTDATFAITDVGAFITFMGGLQAERSVPNQVAEGATWIKVDLTITNGDSK